MIARELENALAWWLKGESQPDLGGYYRFKTGSGEGADLPIRTGHDERGELPEDGFLLVECLDSGVSQVTIGLNAFTATVNVQLVYPSDNHSGDPSTLPSFDACVDEVDKAILRDDLPSLLTEQGAGVGVLGFSGGFVFQSGIDGRNRTAQWTIPLAASKAMVWFPQQ